MQFDTKSLQKASEMVRHRNPQKYTKKMLTHYSRELLITESIYATEILYLYI